MCDTPAPSTVSNAGTGLQLAGLFASTAGAYRKSSGEEQGYKFQSQIAKQNATISDMQAHDAMTRGQQTENNVRQRASMLAGTQRAQLAARGIDLGTGSALDILNDTQFMGERDALIARDNAAKEVWGYKVQGVNATNQGEALDWRASQQSPAGDAFATLLGGAGKVASSWYSVRNKTDRANDTIT